MPTIQQELQQSLHSFQFSSDLKRHGTLPGHRIIMKPMDRKTRTVGSPVMTSHFRRKSLPPLSESPPKDMSSSSSSTTIHTPPMEDEDIHVPHLHNRLKHQNQAILTTYDDWRIILTNSIAQDVLVSHLHDKMNEEEHMLLVGKSVMDLIEPFYQNRLKSMIVKRKNELIHFDNTGGMVLVCGNVVKHRILMCIKLYNKLFLSLDSYYKVRWYKIFGFSLA